MSPGEVLAAAWVQTIAGLGGDTTAAQTSGTEMQQRYGEAHRSYHNAMHVEAVLGDIGVLADEIGLDADQRAVAVLAGCAHDVVYDLQPGADERSSAAWAHAALTGAGIPAPLVQRVSELVLLTITHDCDPADLAAAVLLDADLAILGADTAGYQRYVRAVRAEYSAVSDTDWRTGRAGVLDALLAGPLFRTRPGRERWDAAARRNMAAELAGLRSD